VEELKRAIATAAGENGTSALAKAQLARPPASAVSSRAAPAEANDRFARTRFAALTTALATFGCLVVEPAVSCAIPERRIRR
jgi:hypothetical protein